MREQFGKEPLCNHRPDRGIWIGGFCLPLCARCTGILTGAVVTSIVARMLGVPAWIGATTSPAAGPFLLMGLFMIVPTGVDGILEYRCGRESNNPRRLVTGLLAGAGCAITEMVLVGMR